MIFNSLVEFELNIHINSVG